MNNMPEVTQVSAAYKHYGKVVRGHGVIDPAMGRLKWYDINRSDKPFKHSISDLARSFVSRKLASDDGPSAQELGFVFLHRCGENFYFLGLCTWRGNNELWKTIYFLKPNSMEDFALHPQDAQHKDTFCVWELAVVNHEMQAWTTYLLSGRTDQDADTYLKTLM